MYSFKELTLQRSGIEKKRLVIQFEDENMAIVAQFLMTEVGNNGMTYIDGIVSVEKEETPLFEGTGNLFAWHVTKEKSVIEDVYYDAEEQIGYEPIELKTADLKKFITVWTNTYEAWKKGTSI